MHLPRNIINDVVPIGFPPPELIPPFARELSENITDEVLRRSYLWANAIITVGFQRLPPGCTHFSAGFVYINPGMSASRQCSNQAVNSFLFGGYVLVKATEENTNQSIFTIEVDGLSIPMVINYGRFVPHGCPPHPEDGSAACWVKNRASVPSWHEGILTCRHVIEHMSEGDLITLDASKDHCLPTEAALADIDACTIDAAILEIDTNDFPTKLKPLLIHKVTPPAPGNKIKVNFSGRISPAVSGSVLRIFQCSRYPGNLFGQRIIIDCVGDDGDSGSLLLESSTGEGLGLYMGTIPDGGKGKEGICQDLKQVANHFKLDLYY